MKFCPAHRPLILAHRGDTSSARENSAQAVRSAKKMGYDGVEIDVRMTGDGHLVVAHDPEVNGITIAGTDLREVRRKAEVDLLDEVLAEAEGMLVDLEIKGPISDAVSVIKKLKAVTGMFPRCDYLVSSFWVSILEEVRRLMPGLPVGVLTSAAFDPEGELGLDVAIRKRFDLILPSASAISGQLIQKASSSGIEVIGWTENDTDRFLELRDLGICGVITDTPRDMLALR